MTYEGFLRIGGVDVVNTERIRGYLATLDCPRGIIKTDPCVGLAEAVGDEDYTYDDISLAPWYDVSMPEVSSRFYGVVGLDLIGMTDSTRTATMTEGIDPGGVIGGKRKGMRSVIVQAMMFAKGRDALDYGDSWLNSVFDGTCSTHGTACGTTDAEFFTECPPALAMIPDFSPWTETRRNLVVNPGFRTNTTGWTAAAGGGAAATIVRATNGTQGTPVSTYARLTYTATGTWFRAAINTETVLVPGQSYTMSAWLRGAPSANNFRMFIQWRLANGSLIVEEASPNVPLGPSFTRSSFTAVAPAGAVYATLQWGRSSAAVGDFFDISGTMFEATDSLGEWFDGSTPATVEPELEARHSWAGTANASASIEETRFPIERPQTAEEYAAAVNARRRFMHNVAVTSGPTQVRLVRIPDTDIYGKIVEWTLTSERPWLYGIPRTVTLNPTLPTVAEDTPFNRVTHPSAELGSGSVTISTNLSANPSVETSDAGWLGTFTTISGTSPSAFLTSARSTELAAVGSASFRRRLLGNNGTTAVTAAVADMIAYQDVSLPAGTDRRISLNMWAACLITAGQSPNTVLQSLTVRYLFLNGGAAVGGTTVFGTAATADFGGNAYSLTGLAVPATADAVRISAAARVTWSSLATAGQNSDIRLFVDALQVSVP
jgi:hypothetical protein